MKIDKSKEQICKRAAVSLLLAQYACEEEAERAKINLLIEKYVSAADFTPVELVFWESKGKTNAPVVSWGGEATVALLWVLGHIQELDEPIECADYDELQNILTKYPTINDFINNSILRDANEIKECFDNVFKQHWGCVNIKVLGITKDNCFAEEYDEEIVMERRRALAWVLDEEAIWDSPILDT